MENNTTELKERLGEARKKAQELKDSDPVKYLVLLKKITEFQNKLEQHTKDAIKAYEEVLEK